MFDDHRTVGNHAAVAMNRPATHHAATELHLVSVPTHSHRTSPVANTKELSSRNGTTDPGPKDSDPIAQKMLARYLPVLMRSFDRSPSDRAK